MKRASAFISVLFGIYGVAVSAGEIYCPPQVFCSSTNCQSMPFDPNFYTYSPSRPSDGSYVFNQAWPTQNGSSQTEAQCAYEDYSGNRLFLSSRVFLIQDSQALESKWFVQSYNPTWWTCIAKTPNNCPFQSQ